MPCDSNGAITCSPSVMAELDAQVPLSLCDASCGSASRAVCCHTILPSFRLIAMITKRCTPRTGSPPRGACGSPTSPPAGTAVNRKTRSPQTTGDAEPRPGISIFQRRFFDSLHSAGGVADAETPLICGPRHCGQNSSAPFWATSGGTRPARIGRTTTSGRGRRCFTSVHYARAMRRVSWGQDRPGL